MYQTCYTYVHVLLKEGNSFTQKRGNGSTQKEEIVQLHYKMSTSQQSSQCCQLCVYMYDRKLLVGLTETCAFVVHAVNHAMASVTSEC